MIWRKLWQYVKLSNFHSVLWFHKKKKICSEISSNQTERKLVLYFTEFQPIFVRQKKQLQPFISFDRNFVRRWSDCTGKNSMSSAFYKFVKTRLYSPSLHVHIVLKELHTYLWKISVSKIFVLIYMLKVLIQNVRKIWNNVIIHTKLANVLLTISDSR